ncbi:MAG: peptidoglycan DD-metalloendopeptidase family protein [Rhizobiales bacterium]|nr:peptidoglycan DD-metalloendopeptidase family protein [Hyphomicrobiales bacterium]
MCTRVSRHKSRLFFNAAFISFAGVIFAGCSENASRFDHLFTSSVTQPTPHQGVARFSDPTNLPQADLPQKIPQRVDAPPVPDPNANLFNARNVTRLNAGRGFGAEPRSQVYAEPQARYATQLDGNPQFGSSLSGGSQYGAPIAGRQAALAPQIGGRPSSIASQPLPPVQTIPRRTTLATPSSPSFGSPPFASQADATAAAADRGRLTLDQARAINDSERAEAPVAPSLGRSASLAPSLASNSAPQSLGTLSSPSASQVDATDWTKRYLPVPTGSPGGASGGAPRAYTPPAGSGIDQRPTSSIAAAPAPRIIRASAGQSAISSAPATVDHQTVASIAQPSVPSAGRGGWSAAGGTYVVLAQGDTLASLSRRYGVPVKEIAAANNISDPASVRAGQQVLIPTYGFVPAQSGQAVAAVAATPGVDPTVTSTIARPSATGFVTPRSRPSYQPRATAAVLPINKPETAKQALVRTESAPVTAGLPRIEQTKASVAAYQPPRVQPAPPVVAKAEPAKTATKAEVKETGFIWPVRGTVISEFGSIQNGARNDGIDLEVPKGTPVRAAASGEVIYASNGLADYGNLVLVRHPNGFVSAYAHNSEISVRRGDQVRQGQVLAKSGDSGSVTSPRVHFELREGKQPVNPSKHLPG